MHERKLVEIRSQIRSQAYVMTVHAEEEMNDDGLSIFDIEHCIFSGNIIERQKDINTAEWKYRI